MNLTQVALAYFVMAAVMFGAGLIVWEDTGFATLIIDNGPDEQLSANEETAEDLNDLGGPIEESAGSYGGGIIAVLNLVTGLFDVIFWPIATLLTLNAPPRVVVLFGGTPTAAFYLSVITLIKTSA